LLYGRGIVPDRGRVSRSCGRETDKRIQHIRPPSLPQPQRRACNSPQAGEECWSAKHEESVAAGDVPRQAREGARRRRSGSWPRSETADIQPAQRLPPAMGSPKCLSRALQGLPLGSGVVVMAVADEPVHVAQHCQLTRSATRLPHAGNTARVKRLVRNLVCAHAPESRLRGIQGSPDTRCAQEETYGRCRARSLALPH